MSEKQTSSNNPFIDAWWAGSEQVLRVQSEWLDAITNMNTPSEASEYVDNAHKNWQQCEEQFQAWLSASGHWFEGAPESKSDYSESFDALKSMLNPSAFFTSGLVGLDNAFQRLAEGPDFADIGVFEKKFLRINQDWNAMHEASVNYQTVISNAWMEAFRMFSDEVTSELDGQPLSAKDMLQRWLEITNDLLVKTQRSDEFLLAQRKLLSASTQFKLKQKEVVELWCENMTIPTRSEVDDLHQIVYQLRREVRKLTRELNDTKNIVSADSKKENVEISKKTPVNLSVIETQSDNDALTSKESKRSGKSVKKNTDTKHKQTKPKNKKANRKLASVKAAGKKSHE